MSTFSKSWISIGRAAEKLGTDRRAVRRLIESGRLSVRRIPGTRTKVWAPDVAALAEQSIQRAQLA